MNNTKWLRRALLGGAALSVMATGAQADELSALKAQLEVLQSRVSQLETQPAPALPPGTKLLSIRKGNGSYPARNESIKDRVLPNQGYTISVTPTADMPAPVSEVTVSGEIRFLAIYSSYDVDGDSGDFLDLDEDNSSDTSEYVGTESSDFDLSARGRLRVDGRTETAIGEIGGSLRVQGNSTAKTDENAVIDLAWGYWQMTPNLQLAGGWDDSTATITAGFDNSAYSDPIVYHAGPTTEEYAQLRLTYNSGGFTAAIAMEANPDGDEDFNPELEDDENKFAVLPGIAGRLAFDTGSLLLIAAGKWEQDKREYFDDTVDLLGDATAEFEDSEDNWVVGAGAVLRLSDALRFEVAANVGEGMQEFDTWSSQCGTTACENDMQHWSVNGLMSFNFAESWIFELGGGYSSLDHEEDEGLDDEIPVTDVWFASAALVWNPVDQFTMVWGVGFNHHENDPEDVDDGSEESDLWSVGLATYWRF